MNLKKLKDYYFGIDGIILVLSLLALLTSIYYLLQDDSLSSSKRGELVAVGKFSNSRNDVRRRIQSGFVWSTINTKDTVYEGDSIFTGDESEASIQLEGGGRIQIDPKSLVVVKTQGKGLRVDLQYGSLVGKVSDDAPLLISQNGELKELSAKDAEIRIESSGPDKETKIRVVKGEVQLNTIGDDGKKPGQVIKQNEVLEMAPDSQPVVKRVQVELVAPETGRTLWMPLGQSVVFQWKFVGGKPAAKSKLEISRDLDFKEVVSSYDVPGTAVSLPDKDRPTGTFHWRIRPLSSGKQSEELPSSSARLTLYPDIPPLPVFPAENQEFAYNDDAGEVGKEVALTWEDQSGSTEFELQLAKDSEFKDVIFKKRVTTTNEKTPVLPAGSYHWRVKGLHPQRLEPPWSRAMRFAIEADAKTPEAPLLAETHIKYEIPVSALNRAPAGVSLSGRGVQPERLNPFEWGAVPSAEGYEVEVASSETFENSIKQQLVNTQTTFSPQEVKPGVIFVRVRAKGRKGLVSEPSQVGRLDISLPAPMMDTPKPEIARFTSQQDLDKAKHEFKFKWTPRPFAESYEFEWGADPTFERSKKFRLKNSERSIVVTKPGDYAARVRPLGPDGIPLGPYSDTHIAMYRKELVAPVIAKPVPKPAPAPAPPPVARMPAAKPKGLDAKPIGLPTPALHEPKPDTSVVSVDGSVTYVNFRWSGIKGATFYEVQISEDADFTKVVDKFRSRTNRMAVQKDLPEGRLYWRVRAHSKEKASEWSDAFDLNVLYQ